MGILTPFTSPHDIRWQQGAHRHHHITFIVKNLVLIPFTILIIVEYALLRSWKGFNKYYDLQWLGAPYQFWYRIGMAFFPDLLFTLISLILILNPMHHSTYAFHPIYALVSSFIMFILYAMVCWLNPFVMYGDESSFEESDTWLKIAFAETGLQVVLCLLWGAMMVFSCIAVHKWRMAKKNGAVKMETLQGREENDGHDGRV